MWFQQLNHKAKDHDQVFLINSERIKEKGPIYETHVFNLRIHLDGIRDRMSGIYDEDQIE